MKNAVDIRETLNVNVNVNATKQDNLKFVARVSMSASYMEFIEKKNRAAHKMNVGMRLKKASFLTLYCISVYKCISIYHQWCAKHANVITRKQEELTGAIVSGLIFEETIALIITFLTNSLQRNSTFFCKKNVFCLRYFNDQFKTWSSVNMDTE